MQEYFLTQPVPIVFVVVQNSEHLPNGRFNLYGITDQLVADVPIEHFDLTNIPIRIVTVWTGARGTFRQTITALDEDGREVHRSEGSFTLDATTLRNVLRDEVRLPPRYGTYALILWLGNEQVERQDFRISPPPAAPSGQSR